MRKSWLLTALLVLSGSLPLAAAPWVDRYNGSFDDNDEGLDAIVSGGALYVVGRTTEPSAPGSSVGVPRGFIARHDLATGARVWTLVHGASEGPEVVYSCHRVLAAPNGDLLVGCSRGYGSVAVLRVTSAGELSWMRTQEACLCLPNFDTLEIDAAGNVYLGGRGQNGALVKAYDALGQLLGTWQYPMSLEAMAVDPAGNVYFAGAMPVPDRATEAVVVKLAPGGGEVWSRSFGDPDRFANDGFSALALAGGRLLASGGFGFNAVTASDGLAVALDLDGTVLWQIRHDGAASGDDAFVASVPTPGGGLYLVGFERAGSGGFDALVARVDTAGQLVWSRTLAGPGGWDDWARAVTLAPDGGVVIGGSERLVSGNQRYLYARFDLAGTLLDRQSYAGPLEAGTGVRAVAVDNHGNAYATGGSFGGGTGVDIGSVRFDSPAAIFRDDFEAGDLAAWSGVMGLLVP